MAGIDLGAEFDKITRKAQEASGNLRAAAAQSNRDLLWGEAKRAQERASAAADRLSEKASAGGGKDSPWQEMQVKWQGHVAKVRATVKAKKDQSDADVAVLDADLAEDSALDAIAFAQAAIDEAESAMLGAIYSRTNATVLNS
jgi:hypothetical protein